MTLIGSLSCLLCLSYFALLQWSPSFADPDSFYHAKATALMSQEGIIKNFPWLKFTSFTQNFTDQHFLYHLFLLPFILIFPPLLGTKIAAVLFAALAIFFFYFFLKRWGIRWPWFYILAALSIPPFIFRLNLAKAGSLSLIVLLIGLSLIWQKRYRALGILSFFYVWLHGGWSLLLLLSICSIIAHFIMSKTREIKEIKDINLPRHTKIFNIQYPISLISLISLISKVDWKLIGSIVIGLIAGLIINPYFPHNLQFYWEQVVQIGFLNYQDAIGVGMEWYPYKMGDFVAGNAFGLILAIGALAAFFWRLQKITQILSSSAAPDLPPPLNPPLGQEGTATDPLLLKEGARGRFQKILTLYLFSGILLVMTLKSQRFIEYFAPFFILANAFLLNFSLPNNFSPWPSVKNFFKHNLTNKIIVIYLVAVWLIFFAGKSWDLRQQLTGGFDWHYLQSASQWLIQNTPYRHLIFHSGWSDFPMLFYHNDHNVYLAGMDPTFFYRSNRELYKKWDKIIRAQEPQMADIIKNDFGSNFVLIKLKEKPLLEMVEKNPAFVLRHGDEEAKVFEIQ